MTVHNEDSGRELPVTPSAAPADLADMLALYALDALDAEDRAAVERRLAGDPQARAMLAQLRETAGTLADVPAQAPPPRAKQRVLARIDADLASEALRAPPRDLWSRLGAAVRAVAPFAAAFALVVACGLGAWAVSLQQQLAQTQREVALLQAADLRVAALPNAAAAPPGARITFAHAPGASTGVLTVRGLQPLGPEQTYEFWLLRNGQPVPAGTFAVDASGAGRLVVQLREPIGAYEQAGITIEPAGGSATPTLSALVSFGDLN